MRSSSRAVDGNELALKRLMRAIARGDEFLLITRLPRRTLTFDVDVSYVSMGDTKHLLKEVRRLRRAIKGRR